MGPNIYIIYFWKPHWEVSSKPTLPTHPRILVPQPGTSLSSESAESYPMDSQGCQNLLSSQKVFQDN